jgi:hypothetical protein
MQALVLMNDPTYVEAARALATRALKTPDPARFLFQTTLLRDPSAAEERVIAGLAARGTAKFRQDRPAADKLLKVGETAAAPEIDAAGLAAWTTAASVVLSLDEAITKQ